MRLRLLGVLGLVFALACGGMGEGFQQGMDQAIGQSLAETEAKVAALPPGPNRKRVLELITRAQGEAGSGKLELVEVSVWMGEIEAAIADGELSDDDVATLSDKYEAMVAQ